MPTTETPIFQASMTQQKPKFFNQQGKSRPLCTYCGLLGHTNARCYKLHGYPTGYKVPAGTGSKGQPHPQNGIHMVYSQSPDQMMYSPEQSSHIQSMIPQSHLITYNGNSYAPIFQANNGAPYPLYPQAYNGNPNDVNKI